LRIYFFAALVSIGLAALVSIGLAALVGAVLVAGIDAAGVGVAAAKLTVAPPINEPATTAVTSTFLIFTSFYLILVGKGSIRI